MRKSDRYVTADTARKLKKLNYHEKCCHYFVSFKSPLVIHNAFPSDWNSSLERFVSLPTCDEVIEWLQDKNKDLHVDIMPSPNTSTNKVKYGVSVVTFSTDANVTKCEIIAIGSSYTSVNMAKRKMLRTLISRLLNV